MSPSTTTAFLVGRGRRTDFQGNTDKYMPWRATTTQAKTETVTSDPATSFFDTFADYGVFNEFYRVTAAERIQQYKEYARFYKGDHWVNPFEDGEKKPVFNHCKSVVDKSVDFFAGKSFVTTSRDGDKEFSEVLDAIWDNNNKESLLMSLGLGASVLGDTFLYVSIEKHGSENSDNWELKLNQIDAFFCYPVFSATEVGKIVKCLIQVPTGASISGVPQFTYLFFTEERCVEVNEVGERKEYSNPFGIVPVAHLPNYVDPLKVWGQSDLSSLISINMEYNTVANSIRKIIKYHSEPTTLIFGAKASRLEKGANKVWSGLPTDAKVENLAFDADLAASYNYLNLLKENIHQLGQTPSVLYDTERAVSHTSGVAMKMLYQPILDKTARKQEAFTAFYYRVTEIIIEALRVAGVKVDSLLNGRKITDYYPDFPDPLPYDETAQVDCDIKKLQSKLITRESLVRKYNPGCNFDRLAAKLAADEAAELALVREKAVATGQGKPCFKFASMSSISVSMTASAHAALLSALEAEYEEEEETSEDDSPDETTKE